MKTVTIKTETIKTKSTDENGKQVDGLCTKPVIPFSEFPAGHREAGPDADGNLVWTVYVEE